MRRGMETISLWHCSGVMEAQVALIVAFRSSALLGLVSLVFLLTILDRFSMGFRSGCYESGSHSLKLHITHGLHFPSCTALTHSRPPLHPSHSCHHSPINPDCLTTPAPHSLTHIKAAHMHSLFAKSCFALATFLSVLPRICYLCV